MAKIRALRGQMAPLGNPALGWSTARWVTQALETDYLFVGAGAMGMAFTDALIDHAEVHVTLVDRRHVAGGHWQDAYPFVQLHQASVFYGFGSTVLGSGVKQQQGRARSEPSPTLLRGRMVAR